VLGKIAVKFRNMFLKTQLCEGCGRDLTNVKPNGFKEDYYGMGEYKICPDCGKVFYP